MRSIARFPKSIHCPCQSSKHCGSARPRKSRAMDKLEIKAAIAVDDAGTITGTAWPFGSPDRVGDLIEKGAFNLAVTDLPMLLAHDPEQPIGLWDEVRETNDGLQVKGRLFIEESRRARTVRGLIQGGLITGLSIGFKTKA